MLALQILSAILLLLNKYFVFKRKTIGWTFGIWGTIAITIYFYLQMILEDQGNLWIMIVYDVAIIFLMIYGYLVSVSDNNTHLAEIFKKHSLLFKVVIVSITFIVCLGLLVQAINANLVIIQFLSAVGGLAGTLLLAFNKRISSITGWVFYFFTHLIVVYLMLETGSPWIAICQVLSAIISIAGFKKELHNRAP
jgi:hypothetical protein